MGLVYPGYAGWRIGNYTRINKMIVKRKDGYYVTSEKGKNLGGPYKTRETAEKRLRQVEYFKHNK
jgi:hypothetical protein